MKPAKRFEKDRLRRGIYLLPNIFTSFNLFCGFYSIVASVEGKFTTAAAAIIIAGVFDLLDGKIARATRTTSKFGVEYDSLADLISFGLAPGLMAFLWALKPLGRVGWLAAFLYMACGSLRLARFNTQVGRISSDFFVGLPIPAAAGMTAVTILIFDKFQVPGSEYPVLVLLMLYGLAFLMVSTIKYYSFKKLELFKKMNFNFLVATVLVLSFVAAQPSAALFLCGAAYVISGPILHFRHSRKIRQRQAEAQNMEDQRPSHV